MNATRRLPAPGLLTPVSSSSLSWADMQKDQIPPVGSHLAIKGAGGIYRHHAIYVGTENHWVIHYSGDFRGAWVQIGTLEALVGTHATYRRCTSRSDTPEVVITRALLNLERRNYSLDQENCEHFASFCRCGNPESDQVGGQPWTALPAFMWGMAKHTIYNYCDFVTIAKNEAGAALVDQTRQWLKISRPVVIPSFAPTPLHEIPVVDWKFYANTTGSSLFCSSTSWIGSGAASSTSWFW